MAACSHYFYLNVSLLVIATFLLHKGMSLDLQNKPPELRSDASLDVKTDNAIDGDLNTFSHAVNQSYNVALVIGLTVPAVVLVFVVLVCVKIDYKRKAHRRDRTSTDEVVRPTDITFDERGEMQESPTNADINLQDVDTNDTATPTQPKPEPVPEPRPRQPFNQPRPVCAGDLAQYIEMKESAKEEGFEGDFKTLPEGQLHPWTTARKPENKQKNRFANVIAYDRSRIVLSPMENDPHSDYINACYVDGYKEVDKYIASQGPNKASLRDIWRMVWQLGVDKIVMLTNPVENGKTKCLKYWPDTGTSTFSDITVSITNEEVFLDYTVRLFSIQQFGSEERGRLVKQFHYTTWPDMTPPKHPAPLLNFLRVVNADRNKGRTMVHCSAGIGRTGTYIALDSMLEQMKQEGQVDVLGFIYRMRQKRVGMVQTPEQYKFIFDALLVANLTGDTTCNITNFRQKLVALKKERSDSQETGMEVQFKTLREVLNVGHDSHPQRSNSGKLPENVGKNRYLDLIPTDLARPYLMTTVNEDDTNYINANFLPGYRKKDRYIATQMPMPNTVADIWRLVYDQKVTCIIMLNPLDESEKTMCRYWPEEGTTEFGPLSIELIQTTEYKGITGHTFRLRNKKETSEAPRTVCQFQCRDWPSDQEVPDFWQGMLTLMELTQKWHEDRAPIVVHCMDGLSRTAVYCTLMSLLEQFKKEMLYDVFQTVLRFRLVNHSMMYSLDHYALCYEVFQAYLDTVIVYENV